MYWWGKFNYSFVLYGFLLWQLMVYTFEDSRASATRTKGHLSFPLTGRQLLNRQWEGIWPWNVHGNLVSSWRMNWETGQSSVFLSLSSEFTECCIFVVCVWFFFISRRTHTLYYLRLCTHTNAGAWEWEEYFNQILPYFRNSFSHLISMALRVIRYTEPLM